MCPLCSFHTLESAEEVCVHKTAAASQQRTSLRDDDFPLPLLMLGKCMQISVAIVSIIYILCIFLEIKEGYFTEQAQIPTGSLNLCIMCLLYGDLFTRTKTHKGRNSDKHQTPHSEKEKTIQTRDCCENVFCDEN